MKYIKCMLKRIPLAQAILLCELIIFIAIHYIYKNISFFSATNAIEGHKICIEQLLFERLDISHLQHFGSNFVFFLLPWRLIAAFHFT